ncbi:MAG: tryptophan--tRNA ligase [Chlamydiia bacterium]|nr:tryptophan--tRNA ligase [Chlamydiia bacterium]
MKKQIMLTGDRPTGRLHLGHFVGSLKKRVEMQGTNECFVIIADLHMLTTKPEKEHLAKLPEYILDMVATYLACGIDPEKTTIFLQSKVRAIFSLNLIFGMLATYSRLQAIPSIKEMAKAASLTEEGISLGLYNYPVLQSADILAFEADVVPVGRDNEAHIEFTRHLAKKFNRMYGEVFKVPRGVLEKASALVGTDGKAKMSKSLNNAIYLSDSTEEIKRKVVRMYTDSARVKATTPGRVEGNPVFEYLYQFDKDLDIVNGLAERYKQGTVSDVEVKERLFKVLEDFIAPIRDRRNSLLKDKENLTRILREGSEKASARAEDVLERVSDAMGMKL